MENENEEPSAVDVFLEYASVLWHWTWLLVLMALISGVVTYFISNQQTPLYESSTLVLISGSTSSQADSYSSIMYGQQLTTTYSMTMVTTPVLDAVYQKLGYSFVKDSVSISPISNTNLIRVTVTNTNPKKAADIANTIVSVFSSQLQNDQSARYTDSESSLENQIGQLDDQISTANSQIITLSKAETPDTAAIAQLETNLAQFQQSRSYLVQSYETVRLAEAQSNNIVIQKEPAVPNKSPISPMPLKSALLSALVGLLIAGGIVFLIELLEDTIRDPEEITRKWGIPVLGLIANYNTKNSPIITINQPRSPISESFRSLRTNLQFAGAASPIHSLLVTSASPEDGKTSLVANLAVVLAQNERDVIVIDGDLRKPRIHKIFQLSNRIGLSDYFLHTQDKLNGLVKKTGITGLNVITSGGLPPNPSELLNSEKMVEVIHLLATHFDTVIIDTPPLLAVTDALVLSPRVDAVILVIDPNKTKRASIRHAIEQLRRVNANLVGVVLNNVKNKRSSYYYHRGYYYGKEYGRESGSFELIPDSVNEGENVDSIKHQKE